MQKPEKINGLYQAEFEKDSCGVGFLCHVKGGKSNSIIRDALTILKRLAHRGAVGSDPDTGDGAGILIQIPHEFFTSQAQRTKIELPGAGEYGSGLVFLPRAVAARGFCKETFLRVAREEGQPLLGWRKVPVDDSCIGKAAKETQPVIEQIFIARGKKLNEGADFERKLYLIRKRVENIVRASNLAHKALFCVTNISSRTFTYKGLLMPHQLEQYFLDLQDKSLKSAIALVHSRYSTNTFPTWNLAQPFRFLAHNGEINTLRGNINWMQARRGLLKSPLFKGGIRKIEPIIVPGGSDSAALDNVFELLLLSGRTLPQAMMMLIPSAWENNRLMDKKLRDFYQYHACLMEPWDGPAAIAFTDGTRVGAVLDRNGLRPARFIVTQQGCAVMASEAGVLDIPPRDILRSGRLEPGKMLFIDTEEGRIIEDREIKEAVSSHKPYGSWLKENMRGLDDLPQPNAPQKKSNNILTLLKAFGFTREDLKVIIKHMAKTGAEPIGSMGNDTPLAVLSQKPQLAYNYFKQLFAQVTNPAIDPIREELIMSLESFIGPQANLLEEGPGHCRRLRVKDPILTNPDLEKIRAIKTRGFKTKTLSLLFKAGAHKDFSRRLEWLCRAALAAVEEGYTFIILSDRSSDRNNAALPALLATGAVHHYLVKKAKRTHISIIVESAEPREVHHFALLFGYGADCVNPYLAYDALGYLIQEGELELDFAIALENYRKAVNKGVLKILSKMGISTLQSYRGAQIFEALGLSAEVIKKCFAQTVSRIGGVGFNCLAEEAIARHNQAYPKRDIQPSYLNTGGVYQWKKDGEFHLWNPESIAALQDAVRSNDYKKYKDFARLINEPAGNPATLRSLLKFKEARPLRISEVERAEEIIKRFVTGAMSFGSISRKAHETIAIAMNRMAARSNTGEGGEDPARFAPLPNRDSARSAVKQVASGRFGVTTNYLVNADELQIKIAQGAKPGEGGQLPGHKVSAIIARTRYTTQGVTLISPPPHHDIYSIEDLAQLIFDLKNVNPRANISVKLVSEAGVGTVAAGVTKGHADIILISGGDGGTGASPRSSIMHAGLPWELGLAETHQTLVLNNLRSRVRLQTDGQMRTARDVAIAALLGAEEYGFCTSILVALGCVMLRNCHLNNCALGIAAQEEILEKRFPGRPEYIQNYLRFVATELREIMAGLGLRRINDMVGKSDLLQANPDIIPPKAKGIDYARILYRPPAPKNARVYCHEKQDYGIEKVLDRKLIEYARPALEGSRRIKADLPIKNDDRSTGAMLSGEVCKRYGENGLPEDTMHFKFRGSAGQSFGAWLAKGITFELEGLANDYVGKGISGGRLIIYPDRCAAYAPQENIIIGNTAFYGAISGQAYICGKAGERFCVRNSGLAAVIEGVGDHGCEYMTGGRVVVLGQTGRNFAAGMSGGIAYVLEEGAGFSKRCNPEMVLLENISDGDKKVLHNLLRNHYHYTKSAKAKAILGHFPEKAQKFVKVMPKEYKRILEGVRIKEKPELCEVSDG